MKTALVLYFRYSLACTIPATSYRGIRRNVCSAASLQATQMPHTTALSFLQSSVELSEAVSPFYRRENRGSAAKPSSVHTKQADAELRFKSSISDASCSFLFQNTSALQTLGQACEWGSHSSEPPPPPPAGSPGGRGTQAMPTGGRGSSTGSLVIGGLSSLDPAVRDSPSHSRGTGLSGRTQAFLNSGISQLGALGLSLALLKSLLFIC